MRSYYPNASVTNIIFAINKLKMVSNIRFWLKVLKIRALYFNVPSLSIAVKSVLQRKIKLCNLNVDHYNLPTIIFK